MQDITMMLSCCNSADDDRKRRLNSNSSCRIVAAATVLLLCMMITVSSVEAFMVPQQQASTTPTSLTSRRLIVARLSSSTSTSYLDDDDNFHRRNNIKFTNPGPRDVLQQQKSGPTKRWNASTSSRLLGRKLGMATSLSTSSSALFSQGNNNNNNNFVVDATIIIEDDDDDSKRRSSTRRRHQRFVASSVQALHRARASIRTWMDMILSWQRKQRKSLLLAAAFAFSLITLGVVGGGSSSSSQQQQHFFQQQQQTATHRVMPTRGGGGHASAASPSSVIKNDKMLLESIQHQQPKNGGSYAATTTSTGGSPLEKASRETSRTLREAAVDLYNYITGPKADTLFLLLATALVTPLSKKIGMSPILGFLTSGMLLGPNGFGLISGIHTTETLAELGIVFFLFEMGIELSFERLQSMRRDVFGLGLCQFVVTAISVFLVGQAIGTVPANALVVLGGGIALSSSAFVLQILKDNNQLATRFGKASFGILLFQDLAVVPLLVVTPLLAGGPGSSLTAALGSAVVKAALALGAIGFGGRFILNPLFKTVAAAQSQEAFLGVVLLTVLSMSFLTEGLGLSNTLGAFLAGVLLSETKYRYQVEADIAPFRGVLLGLFFVTVGFEIDLKLIASNLPTVGSLVLGILSIKALITTLLSLAFGLSLSTSQQTGLMLSQGGEFAFVAFGLARSLGIIDPATTKLMLTSVSLTMAATPFMAQLGQKISKKLEENSDFSHYLGQDRDANEIKESEDFTVIVGYGAVGKVVCDLLGRRFIKFVGLEVDPNKVIQARNAGLPVFYGDIGRQEVAEAFNVGKATAVVVCIADRSQANRVLIALRRWYPDLKIFARAADADHASRLQNTLNVAAMVPILPEDNLLLTLPFGGAVMKALGVPTEQVNAILESRRKEVLSGRGLAREEEEVALLQLGIGAKSKSSKPTTTSDSSEARVSEKEKKDGDASDTKRAAAERRKEAEAKSPFVAKVIEEICPESADDELCSTPKVVISNSTKALIVDAEIEEDTATATIVNAE